MQISQEFKFLKVQSLKRKNLEGVSPENQFFYVLNLLDTEMNPIKIYSFESNVNTELTKSINEGKLKPYQNILIDFDLTQNDKGWGVKLNNFTLKY